MPSKADLRAWQEKRDRDRDAERQQRALSSSGGSDGQTGEKSDENNKLRILQQRRQNMAPPSRKSMDGQDVLPVGPLRRPKSQRPAALPGRSSRIAANRPTPPTEANPVRFPGNLRKNSRPGYGKEGNQLPEHHEDFSSQGSSVHDDDSVSDNQLAEMATHGSIGYGTGSESPDEATPVWTGMKLAAEKEGQPEWHDETSGFDGKSEQEAERFPREQASFDGVSDEEEQLSGDQDSFVSGDEEQEGQIGLQQEVLSRFHLQLADRMDETTGEVYPDHPVQSTQRAELHEDSYRHESVDAEYLTLEGGLESGDSLLEESTSAEVVESSAMTERVEHEIADALQGHPSDDDADADESAVPAVSVERTEIDLSIHRRCAVTDDKVTFEEDVEATVDSDAALCGVVPSASGAEQPEQHADEVQQPYPIQPRSHEHSDAKPLDEQISKTRGAKAVLDRILFAVLPMILITSASVVLYLDPNSEFANFLRQLLHASLSFVGSVVVLSTNWLHDRLEHSEVATVVKKFAVATDYLVANGPQLAKHYSYEVKLTAQHGAAVVGGFLTEEAIKPLQIEALALAKRVENATTSWIDYVGDWFSRHPAANTIVDIKLHKEVMDQLEVHRRRTAKIFEKLDHDEELMRLSLERMKEHRSAYAAVRDEALADTERVGLEIIQEAAHEASQHTKQFKDVVTSALKKSIEDEFELIERALQTELQDPAKVASTRETDQQEPTESGNGQSSPDQASIAAATQHLEVLSQMETEKQKKADQEHAEAELERAMSTVNELQRGLDAVETLEAAVEAEEVMHQLAQQEKMISSLAEGVKQQLEVAEALELLELEQELVEETILLQELVAQDEEARIAEEIEAELAVRKADIVAELAETALQAERMMLEVHEQAGEARALADREQFERTCEEAESAGIAVDNILHEADRDLAALDKVSDGANEQDRVKGPASSGLQFPSPVSVTLLAIGTLAGFFWRYWTHRRSHRRRWRRRPLPGNDMAWQGSLDGVVDGSADRVLRSCLSEDEEQSTAGDDEETISNATEDEADSAADADRGDSDGIPGDQSLQADASIVDRSEETTDSTEATTADDELKRSSRTSTTVRRTRRTLHELQESAPASSDANQSED